MRFPAEPFRIKVVEPLRRVSREERERLIREVEAGSLMFGHRDSKTSEAAVPAAAAHGSR